MISISTDQSTLEELYNRLHSCQKAKVLKEGSCVSERTSLINQAAACIIMLDPAKDVSNKRKDKAIRQAKMILRRYIAVRKGTSEFDSKRLRKKTKQLSDALVAEEAKRMHELRCEMPEASEVDLKSFVQGKADLNMFMSATAVDYLKSRLKSLSKNKTVPDTDSMSVCVTDTGKCYHRSLCPHIKNKSSQNMTIKDALAAGYRPCVCIRDVQNCVNADADKKKSQTTENAEIVTAFVDESCRQNPWRVYDESLPETQTSFSYVICHGDVKVERNITANNTIEKNACLARWSYNPTTAAIEAIHTVLEILAIKHRFRKDIIIYTDNKGAVSKWKKNDVSEGLEKLFNSITVSYIPRECNKVADSIGRRRIFADISKETMQKVDAAMLH